MKRNYLLILSFLLCVAIQAQVPGKSVPQYSKLSAATRLFLSQRSGSSQREATGIRKVNGIEMVDAFITLQAGASTSEIEAAGVQVVNTFGSLLTARIPVQSLATVGTLPSVKNVSISQKMQMFNDSSRIYSGVDKLQQGIQLAQQYKGKGVLVGVIDMGIQFDHINFRDASGHSRIKLAIRGNDIYTDSLTIDTLTCDYLSGTHGTHTAGIAAGSYSRNGYQGMAPEADLLLAGNDLEDVQIINALKAFSDYAQQVNRPLVVSMSFGDYAGPYDGTSPFCKVIDSLARAGVIFASSAGNEADYKDYVFKKFEAPDDSVQFKTIISSDSYESLNMDIWNRSDHLFKIQFAITDAVGNELCRSHVFDPAKETDTSLTDSDKVNFSKYFRGIINVSGDFHEGKVLRFYSEISIKETAEYPDAENKLALLVYGMKGDTVEVRCQNAMDFSSLGWQGYTDGDANNVFCDECTAQNIISVGCYKTRNYYTNITGKKKTQDVCSRGDILYWSGFGTDVNGVNHPDVTAPGGSIISSFNGYIASQNSNVVARLDTLGRSYYWGAASGTSMSTPAVAGIIALWLQYKPSLTSAEIKAIIQSTSVKDDFVKSGNPIQWGAGKIDAYAGLQYLLTTNIGNPQCAQHQVLIYPSAESGRINVYAQGETGILRVNVYSASGIQVYSDNVSTTDGSASIDLGNRFAKGVYIVKVEGSQAKGSNTLTVR